MALDLLILAHRAAWEDRYQVSSLAASAAAAGRSVAVGLFFAALAAWVEERWDERDPAGTLAADVLRDFPPLSELLEPGREEGLVRLYACSASLRFTGLEPAAVQARVDAVIGWPTFARMVADAAKVVSL